MSVTASIVALAVMLARIPLKKAPKIFSYALWGVVLFRLVFPFSIESIFSLMPTSANAIPQNIVVSQNPMIQTGVQFIDTPINTTIYNALPPISTENAINPIYTIFDIAGYVWLIGFIALLLYATIGYISLKKCVYFATLVKDNIFETDKIKSPFVLGFIRPKIYFPVTIDPTQNDYILKHEQTHIKRLDYIIKPFAYIVFALHWFNPIMWLSYFLMSKDMEMSCDEAVLSKTTSDIRGEYSTSLLSLAVERVSLLNPIAFSFGESNVKERVVNVLSFKRYSKWVTVVSFMVVVVFFIGFSSNRVNLMAVEIPESSQIPRISDERNEWLEWFNTLSPEQQLSDEWNEWLEWFDTLSPEQQSQISLRPPIENITSDTNERLITFGPSLITPEEKERLLAEDEVRRLALRVAHVEMYKEFGLIYDPVSNHLYFHGELVRYFTDMIPFPDTSVSAGASFGMSHFTESGTVDVRAVRDFSQMVLQGQIDLSKGLLGLEAFTQAEFDARDIDALINPPMGFEPQAMQPFTDNWGTQYAVSGTMITPIDPNLPTPQHRPSTEIFLEYEEWGLTFEGMYPYHDGRFIMTARQNVFFQGQLVRGFSDFSIAAGTGMSLSSTDRRGHLWIHVIRDENGYIQSLEMVNDSPNSRRSPASGGNLMVPFERGDAVAEGLLANVKEFGVTSSYNNIYYHGQLVRGISFQTNAERLTMPYLTANYGSQIVFWSADSSGRIDVNVLVDGVGNFISLEVVER